MVTHPMACEKALENFVKDPSLNQARLINFWTFTCSLRLAKDLNTNKSRAIYGKSRLFPEITGFFETFEEHRLFRNL